MSFGWFKTFGKIVVLLFGLLDPKNALRLFWSSGTNTVIQHHNPEEWNPSNTTWETQIERCTLAGEKNIFQVLSYVPHISLAVMCFILQIPMYRYSTMTLQKSFRLIINCCLCVSLNIRHVGELLKHKSTITPFINKSFCITLCVLNHTLISTSTRFNINWCHQEVQSCCNFFSAHLKNDLISDAKWL
jgi:hypothetical protein